MVWIGCIRRTTYASPKTTLMRSCAFGQPQSLDSIEERGGVDEKETNTSLYAAPLNQHWQAVLAVEPSHLSVQHPRRTSKCFKGLCILHRTREQPSMRQSQHRPTSPHPTPPHPQHPIPPPKPLAPRNTSQRLKKPALFLTPAPPWAAPPPLPTPPTAPKPAPGRTTACWTSPP